MFVRSRPSRTRWTTSLNWARSGTTTKSMVRPPEGRASVGPVMVTEEGQLWISKSSGLPLRAEEDFDNKSNHVKDHRSARFEYGNIRPPV